MAGIVSAFFQSIFAPRLYRIYHRASRNNLGQVYVGNVVENSGDFAISYLVPAGAIFCVWQRQWNYLLYIGVLIVSSYVLRAAGRTFSTPYQTFLKILKRAQRNLDTENAELLRRYDFEFKAWPASFKSQKTTFITGKTPAHDLVGGEASTICWAAGWLVTHTFGIRLLYPGLIFSRLLRTAMEEGRAKYVVEQNGIRANVETSDGNKIDTIFFDRRSEINEKGKTLVITFEGNAGFYEIGMVCTPLDAGYSVLGFNRPGFGGSSGTPYPAQELNAAEAIYDYANTVLGFKDEDILIYSWSIGGFSAAHVAGEHPKIRGIVLDATFDDVLHLAVPKMPAILAKIVRPAIRYHMNLYISKEVARYHGPIRLIRRTEDEIISEPPGILANNRGNYLLTDIIRQRYPDLVNNSASEKLLREWLSKPHLIDPSLNSLAKSEPKIPANLDGLTNEAKARLVVQIAEKIMTDFKSSHCIPLPASYFKLPWVASTKRVSQEQAATSSS